MIARLIGRILTCACFAGTLIASTAIHSQELTLEGQTGGFITPTAYVVYTDKGHVFSHPAVGFHFIDASSVIGYVETFNITEGFANRAEIGYSRSVHQNGNETTGLDLSNLWNYSGMNIFHGKVVGIKDGQFGPWTPGIAVGGVVRTDDHFVSGAANKILTGTDKSYTNGDVYVALTKTWAKPPVPFLLNLGWKATNATIFGIGGQSTRFGGRFFGGLGIPLPLGHGIVAVPAAGFTQQPRTAVNLNNLLNAALGQLIALDPPAATQFPPMSAHLPTTLDYAVRVTQRDKPHFSLDIGIGQVAGNIGSIYVPNPYYPTVGPPIVPAPVNLQARKIFGMGFGYRY